MKTLSINLRSLIWVLIVLLAIGTGCESVLPNPDNITPNPQRNTTTNPDLSDEIIIATDGTQLGSNQNCPSRSAFGFLDEDVPVMGATKDPPIRFRWEYHPIESYPDDWTSVCVPTRFTLYLSPGPDYTNTIGIPITSPDVTVKANLLLFSTVLSTSLQPHTSYRWIIVGHFGSISIDEDELSEISNHESWKVNRTIGRFLGSFQTGPSCEATNIQAVDLLIPINEITIETTTPFFQWDMPDCSSSAYRIQFSTSPDFANIIRGWVLKNNEFLIPEGVLEPCTQYYWRVDSGVNSYTYHLANGEWTTTSDIRTFIIRSPDCPNASAITEPIITALDGTQLGINQNCPDRASFGFLGEDVPVMGVTVDTPINFRWEYHPVENYPSDWSSVCVPNRYTLYLASEPDYDNATSYEIDTFSVEVRPNLLLIRTQFDEPLEPHTAYRWIIAGHSGGINIDDSDIPRLSDHQAWKVYNNTSQFIGKFQTGPNCDPSSIQSAVLLNPPDNAILNSDTPLFQWDMPGCTAPTYGLTFSTNSYFTNIFGQWIVRGSQFLIFPGIFEPCTQYYWRVNAGLFSEVYHLNNDDWATVSDKRTFVIQTDDCPNASANWPVILPTATSVPPTQPPPTTQPTQPPPTIQPTPVVCENITDKETCESYAKCEWYVPPPTTLSPAKCITK